MATQVTKFVSGSSASGMEMSNPTYVYADDTSYATYTSTSRNLNQIVGYWTNLNFEIPADATINSVTVEGNCQIDALVTGVGYGVQLYKGGTTAVGSEATQAFSSTNTDTTCTQSITSSLPSVAELNATGDSGLRVRARCYNGNSNTSRTFSLDYLKVTVDYTAVERRVFLTHS